MSKRVRHEPKDDCMIAHVIKRFKERFDKEVDSEYVKGLAKKIRNNQNCEFLFKQSNVRSVWIMHDCDLDFLAVYQKNKGKLCTVMPLDYLKIDEDIQSES